MTSVKKKILFVVGSTNQTSQMHQIAKLLPDYDCWFTQFYAESKFVNWCVKKGWLDFTILAGQFKQRSDAYLRENHLQEDYQAKRNRYDLAVICSDLIVPTKLKANKIIWVQEGMVDQYTILSKIVQTFRLPRYLSVGTSLNGSSNIADIYCCASEGYKKFFAEKGTEEQKLIVTGMPNFDNLKQHQHNNFPYRNFVLVATTDMRETFRPENRVEFIQDCVSKAKGKPMIFKLHPNELYERAYQEIIENTPEGTLVFQEGNTNEMIANCDVLITQYSTVAYVGIALGKEVHSYFDLADLHRLLPIQNEGTSAQNIANICRDFLEFKGKKQEFVKKYHFEPLTSKLV